MVWPSPCLYCRFLAFLGGISDGTVDVNNIFNHDPGYTYLLFRELVLGEYNDLSGYPFSVAKYYFPDFLLTWLIYGLGANVVWGIYLWMFAVLVISLGGWLLLCDALFSPNLNRRILVILIHALPLIYMAWLGSDIFLIHAMPIFITALGLRCLGCYGCLCAFWAKIIIQKNGLIVLP